MTGWWIGWIVGGVVVALVVALLLLMIRGASRAVTKAVNVVGALEAARDNTAGLWRVNEVNHNLTRIVRAATAAREHLASKGA